MLAEKTPASFIAFDLLALGDVDFTARPFSERRAALVAALSGSGPSMHVTPATTELATAQRWFDEFEGAGLDGVIAMITYQPDKRIMFKIKHERTADCVVAGYRVHKSGNDAIGSLLLGLYKDDDTLASVGVIGAFPMAERRRLFAELQPLVTSFDDHPWNWGGSRGGRAHTAQERVLPLERGQGPVVWSRRDPTVLSRCATTTWKVSGSVTAQFNRWRPYCEPASCTLRATRQSHHVQPRRYRSRAWLNGDAARLTRRQVRPQPQGTPARAA